MYQKLGLMFVGCLALCLAASVPAQAKARTIAASSEYTTHDMTQVAPFASLQVNGQAEVEFWQSKDGTHSVSLYGPKNLVDLVEIKNQDGVLSIQYKEPLLVLGDHHLRVAVMAPSLNRITVEQAGEIKVTGPFQTEDLEIMANGKGEIDFDMVTARSVRVDAHGDGEVDMASLTCDTLRLEAKDTASIDVQKLACDTVTATSDNRADVSVAGLAGRTITAQSHGASEIELKGKLSTAVLMARGRSEIDAGSLQAENADVMAESSARIDVRVSDTLNAQTQGRGVVEYKGWPKQINRSGKGMVKQDR